MTYTEKTIAEMNEEHNQKWMEAIGPALMTIQRLAHLMPALKATGWVEHEWCGGEKELAERLELTELLANILVKQGKLNSRSTAEEIAVDLNALTPRFIAFLDTHSADKFTLGEAVEALR